jgi:hypothetical protein
MVAPRNVSSAKPPSPIPVWMWGAAVVLLLFTIYTSWQTTKLKDEIARTNEQAEAEIAKRGALHKQYEAVQREAMILTDPRSVKIPMAAENKSMPKLAAMWHAQMGIVVTGQNVPMPAENRTLQLWLIPKAPEAKPRPSMMIRPDGNGKFILLVENPPGTMEATKALVITEEPAGGSQSPTSKPIWVGAIS